MTTETAKTPPLIFEDLPEEEKVRNALLMLAQMGYEIHHKGSKLILDRNTWLWKKL